MATLHKEVALHAAPHAAELQGELEGQLEVEQERADGEEHGLLLGGGVVEAVPSAQQEQQHKMHLQPMRRM
jgi:hypothetical protein